MNACHPKETISTPLAIYSGCVICHCLFEELESPIVNHARVNCNLADSTFYRCHGNMIIDLHNVSTINFSRLCVVKSHSSTILTSFQLIPGSQLSNYGDSMTVFMCATNNDIIPYFDRGTIVERSHNFTRSRGAKCIWLYGTFFDARYCVVRECRCVNELSLGCVETRHNVSNGLSIGNSCTSSIFREYPNLEAATVASFTSYRDTYATLIEQRSAKTVLLFEDCVFDRLSQTFPGCKTGDIGPRMFTLELQCVITRHSAIVYHRVPLIVMKFVFQT